jgi:hypothetical protein
VEDKRRTTGMDPLIHNDDVPRWRSRVPPGVPGAGWFVATVFAFSIFMLTGWYGGWWDNNHTTAAAPAPSHHTTGSGNRVQGEK